jgi:hypothetical protein
MNMGTRLEHFAYGCGTKTSNIKGEMRGFFASLRMTGG